MLPYNSLSLNELSRIVFCKNDHVLSDHLSTPEIHCLANFLRIHANIFWGCVYDALDIVQVSFDIFSFDTTIGESHQIVSRSRDCLVTLSLYFHRKKEAV